MRNDIKYPCPCCGYKTREREALDTFEICPVCGWQDDPGARDPDDPYTANRMSLNQARENYRRIGVISEEELKSPYRRPPRPDEM